MLHYLGRPQARQNLSIKLRVGHPGLGGDDLPIANRLSSAVGAPAGLDLEADVLVSGHASPPGEPRADQDLNSMANGANPFALLVEVLDQGNHLWVVSKVLGSPTAQDDDRRVLIHEDFLEGQ